MSKSTKSPQKLTTLLASAKSKFSEVSEVATQTLKNTTTELGNNADPESINSFSTIFNQDHDQIRGVQRVFRKSIILLSLSLLSFVVLAWASINLFAVPLALTVGVFFAYLSLSIIFFIIVADRSYVWLCLLAHVLAILLVSSFVGQLISPVTWATMLIAAILYYFAYTELEKAQLGSRLFSIKIISKEATNLLVTLCFLVLSLGAFGLIKDQGTVNFVEQDVLGSEFIFEEVMMGNGRAINLNRVMIDASAQFGEGNTEYTFREFLVENYRDGGNVIGQTEQTDIRLDCEFERGGPEECTDIVAITREERLIEYAAEAYGEIPYTLDTNDMRFAAAQGFNTGEHFYQYLKDAFDVLYEEGAYAPKLLNIGLHCRIVGRPARLAGLLRFLDYAQGFEGVWWCRRSDIAAHWHSTFKPDPAAFTEPAA